MVANSVRWFELGGSVRVFQNGGTGETRGNFQYPDFLIGRRWVRAKDTSTHLKPTVFFCSKATFSNYTINIFFPIKTF